MWYRVRDAQVAAMVWAHTKAVKAFVVQYIQYDDYFETMYILVEAPLSQDVIEIFGLHEVDWFRPRRSTTPGSRAWWIGYNIKPYWELEGAHQYQLTNGRWTPVCHWDDRQLG